MNDHQDLLTSEAIQMLVSSMTQQGKHAVSEIEMERFLNALTRAQSGVPTGLNPFGLDGSENDREHKNRDR